MNLNLKQLVEECDKTGHEVIIEGLKIILDSNIEMRKQLVKEGNSVSGVAFLNDKIKLQKRTLSLLKIHYDYEGV